MDCTRNSTNPTIGLFRLRRWNEKIGRIQARRSFFQLEMRPRRFASAKRLCLDKARAVEEI
jgi:hypothetical protein